MRAVLIIPALDEEQSIGRVLGEVPPGLFSTILVVDNGSTDRTAEIAAAHGAQVLTESRRGYGRACLKALGAVSPDIDVIVFMDADGSDVPSEASLLMAPIAEQRADLAVGSRELGKAQKNSLQAHQRFGNRLATFLIQLFYRHRYTDLGPFRAVRRSSLRALDMQDPNYGWTVEMQIKALKKGLRVIEVPVSYRQRRGGSSKVSGNLKTSFKAGIKILWMIARLRLP